MHAAVVSKSSRLTRVVDFLGDGGAKSTREIARGAECMAVSAAISELRQRGAVIDCWRENVDGEPRYFYKMLSRPNA